MDQEGNKTILIVEDDDSVRTLEKDFLKKRGYEILEAATAKDGINLALSENPDLILMDVRLPNKKRGIGAARIIRNNEKTKGVPIIFVTAYEKGNYTKEITNIPNCAYITKPFEVGELLKLIKEFIG
ncbi:MAG: response regulator [Candidatus Omnitrophota bacterium]